MSGLLLVLVALLGIEALILTGRMYSREAAGGRAAGMAVPFATVFSTTVITVVCLVLVGLGMRAGGALAAVVITALLAVGQPVVCQRLAQ